MPIHDELGIRMKENYENISKTKLMRRTPVAIRIDGKAFHTFTRGFQKPFDNLMVESMQATMKYLCENIQGCVLGYTQSDEITLILVDYKKLNSSAWFNYEVQKLCSVAASMATLAFNKYFYDNVFVYNATATVDLSSKEYPFKEVYSKAINKGAMFDARAFNIPKEEVTNLLYWRQVNAMRNSIQSVGQAYFSHKELDKKTSDMIQCMLFEERGVNWNDYPTHLKRGSCCVKNKIVTEFDGAMATAYLRDASKPENEWMIDNEIPIFKGEDRKYIDNLIFIGEN